MPLLDNYGNIVWSSSKGVTNNTTPVTVVSDPGTDNPAYVVDTNQFSLLNRDTVSVTMILTITGGTSRIIERITLATGDKFVNSAKIILSAGETLTVELAATITTNHPTWSCSYYQTVN